MGRHSSPEQGPFYRSLVGWVLPWALVAVVFGVGVWVAVKAVGRDELDTSSATRRPTASPEPSPSPTPSPDRATPSAAPDDPTPSETPDLVTDGITVQVLNGTASTTADDAMADKLASLGFEVVAIDTASKTYPETTVFWSTPTAESAADALAARFGWIASPKPPNLSPEVSLHVIVGEDEA